MNRSIDWNIVLEQFNITLCRHHVLYKRHQIMGRNLQGECRYYMRMMIVIILVSRLSLFLYNLSPDLSPHFSQRPMLTTGRGTGGTRVLLRDSILII